MGYSPRGRKESDITERLHFQAFLRLHSYQGILCLCVARTLSCKGFQENGMDNVKGIL